MKSLDKLTAAAMLFAAIGAAQAGTATRDVVVTGTFTASCAIDTTGVALGAVELSTYIVNVDTNAATRYPTSMAVSCNSPTQPWQLFQGAAVNGTIGALQNKFCFVHRTAALTSAGVMDGTSCLDGVTAATGRVDGVGTASANLDLMLYWPDTGSTFKPFRGSGAIAATIPMNLEF